MTKQNTRKSKTSIMLAMIIFSLMAMTGCATIFTSTTQTISVNSNITGAAVSVNGQVVGTTPFSGRVSKSNRAATVEVSSPGFHSASAQMATSIEPWFWGNIITGGLLGSTTDFASGAMWRYKPTSFYANLIPVSHSMNDDSKYLDELKIRYFSMVNHSKIALDSNEPTGEYFNALVSLLESNMDSETATTTIRTALANSQGDQLSFGNELIDRFRQNY